MRSKTVSIRIPQPLMEAMPDLLKVAGFDTINALLVGMIRYAYLHGKKHTVTAEFARQPRAEQDKIDDEIVRLFLSGETMNGSYLQHLIEESVEHVASGQDVPEHKIVTELLRRIGKTEK